jgi:DNA-binding NarL/FixJ family response regulator
MKSMTKILIVDQHALVRKGIRALLESQPDFSVLTEAGNYAEAVRALETQRVDVVIADIGMQGPVPGRDSIDLIAHIRNAQPQARIIVLTLHTENAYASRALKAGADGYVTKDVTPDLLVTAIHRVMAGSPYLSPNVAESLALQAVRQDGAAAHSRLSKRESMIFNLLARGNTVNDIAVQLALSAKTVSAHKIKVLRKMNLRSVAELVRYAIEHEVVCPW